MEYANATLALSNEKGFPLYLARAEILRGWVLAAQGIHEEGIALIHQGLRAHEATGASVLPLTVPKAREAQRAL